MTINPRAAYAITTMLAPGGPRISQQAAQAFVQDLRTASTAAWPLVSELTALPDAVETAMRVDVAVVDRPGWAFAAAQSIRAMISRAGLSMPGFNTVTVGIGAAALARGILGQFDPYCGEYGRLLLNAPNVAAFKEKFNLDQRDVCLWVCVHELTHAMQYAAAPWLENEMVTTFASVIGDDAEDGSLDSPAAQKLVAIMSVLEGHAEYTMNAVPVAAMPGKKRIISAMKQKRAEGGVIKRTIAQILSMDKKAAQYATGSAFVKAVVQASDIETFNKVWERPENMPTSHELAHPLAWLERVEGSAA